MFDITFVGAGFAGLLSFFTPCVLPMVPFYLCYMAGLSMSDLRGAGGLPPHAQRRLVLASVAFALGVTTVFVLLGLGATFVGQVFAEWKKPLSYVAAAVLALFGLHFLGILRIPLLYREARLDSGRAPAGVPGAYVMGLAFGFGWTPCVGPALASILMIAAGMGDALRGGLLLLVYGLGMTAPFVVAALFSGPFLRWSARHRARLALVERIMGGMLLIFAVLIATDTVNLLAEAMLRWMPGFATLG